MDSNTTIFNEVCKVFSDIDTELKLNKENLNKDLMKVKLDYFNKLIGLIQGNEYYQVECLRMRIKLDTCKNIILN